MCISTPKIPPTPPPPPPPPAPPEKTAMFVGKDPIIQAQQDLASRLGTSQLVIPLYSINTPN